MMRVSIVAVSRMKSGPEAELIADYLNRFEKVGKAFGLGPATLYEVEDKKGGGQKAEASLIAAAIPDQSTVIALDERGKNLKSPEFSDLICNFRDDGCRELAFVIGGADGLTDEIRSKATTSISFGKMVWPHMLARVMLSEQLYRAASIAAGTPYHRV